MVTYLFPNTCRRRLTLKKGNLNLMRKVKTEKGSTYKPAGRKKLESLKQGHVGSDTGTGLH
jgi:hypothetical protein